MYKVMRNLQKVDGTIHVAGAIVSSAELGDDKVVERLLSRGWIEEIKRKLKPAEKPLEPSEVNSNG